MTLAAKVKKLTHTVQRMQAELSLLKGTSVRPKKSQSRKRASLEKMILKTNQH